MRSFTLLVALVVVCPYLCGQGFVHQTNAQGISVPVGVTNFGSGVSMFDYNQDGWDDLTVGTKANGTYLYVNNNGQFTLDTILPNPHEGKSACWGDFDHDGLADLFMGTLGGPSQLWRQTTEGFVDVTEAMGIPVDDLAQTYGSAWTDFDLDGDLDLYITNYNQGEGPGNWLLKNHDGAFFEEVAAEVGVDNGVVWSFMPVFADFDRDGWPDLYVINDKQAPNALFRNNGDGTFSDVSVGSNTNVVIDAMSNSVTDFDGDGDLDIYVTNDFTGNRLFRNEGNFVFTDVTDVYNASIDQFCWGGLWIDFDNNRADDLFVCTADYNNNLNPIFRFVIDQPLIPVNAVFSIPNTTPSFSAAKGDYNRDGAPDFVQINQGPQNLYLWRNNWSINHWVGIELDAVISNPQAFGTWVEVCAGGQCRSRYTTSSDGYLAQHSQRLLFGIGQDETIESITIDWPSGHTDTFYDLPADAYHTFTEGTSLTAGLNASPVVLCNESSVELSVLNDFESVAWSTGENQSAIEVSESGWYHVTVVTDLGLSVVDSIFVAEATDANIVIETTDVTCYGVSDGVASVTADVNLEIEWPNGGQGMLIESWDPGTYSFMATTDEGCTSEHFFTIESPDPLELFIEESMPLCTGDANGSLLLSAAGGVAEYTFEPAAMLNNLSAGDHPVTLIDANGCVIDSVFTLSEPEPVTVEVSTFDAIGGTPGFAEAFASGGLPPYSINWSNGTMGPVNAPLDAGAYSVIVIDQNSCVATLGFTIDQVVGINEESEQTLKVWPVPMNEQLTIEGAKMGERLIITDALGQVVFADKVSTEDPIAIDAAHWAAGSYVIKLLGDEIRVVQLVK